MALVPPQIALLLTTVVAALIFFVPGSVAAESRIAVFVSYDAQPVEEMLAGFREQLGRQGSAALLEIYPLHQSSTPTSQMSEVIRKNGTQLILALGSVALETAGREAQGIPVVSGMVLREADIRRVRGATGVFLEYPLETQFEWLRRLLPETRSIGVVYNPAENQKIIMAARQVAGRMGMELIAREVSTPAELPGALDSLANQAEVLWGISDNVVVTPQTARNLLLFSFRNRIPFIGLSSAWVKAGAFYALDRDYRDIGRQCAELALKILAGSDADSLDPVPPRQVGLSLNLKTADWMKITVSPALRRAASQLYQEE